MNVYLITISFFEYITITYDKTDTIGTVELKNNYKKQYKGIILAKNKKQALKMLKLLKIKNIKRMDVAEIINSCEIDRVDFYIANNKISTDIDINAMSSYYHGFNSVTINYDYFMAI